MLRKVCFTCSGGLVFVLILSVLILTNDWAGAIVIEGETEASAEVPAMIIVGEACTGTSTPAAGGTYSTNLTPGQINSSLGSTTFKVTCNDPGGFSVYAIGYSGDEDGNTGMISSTSGIADIATGTATSGTASNWAMKLAAVSGTYAPTITSGWTAFHAVPSTSTKVATFASATDQSTGSAFTTHYQVYAGTSQIAGTYTGKVKYTLVHPSTEVAAEPKSCTGGNICYWPNSSLVEGTMANQTASSASATLYASNYSRKNYGFAGWCTTYDCSDPAGLYGPNQTITTPSNVSSKGLSLYAHWVKQEVGVNMQNFMPNSSPYSAMSNGTVIALRDLRDENVYAVAKLADGKWWMIENLRLDNTAAANTSGTLSQGYAGVFAGLASSESPWANNSTTANSLYTIVDNVQGKNTISGSNQASRFPRYNNQNTNARVTSYSVSGNIYSYGNYYNWPSSMANTNDYSSATAEVDGYTSETVGTSVCPSGWKLPYGRNTGNGNTLGGFYYLNYKINGDANVTDSVASKLIRKYPNNFLNSGYISSSTVYARGTSGYYWSSTAISSSNSYYLTFSSSSVSPGTSSVAKYRGASVRCVVGN